MLAVTVNFNLPKFDRLFAQLDVGLSAGLNKSLFETRDKMVRETFPAGLKGPRGRKVIIKKQIETGRSVFKVKRSEPHNPTGSIQITRNMTREDLLKWRSSLTLKDWIHGFVHSTHPIFWGKTKQDRIRMALGAYYRISRGVTLKRTTTLTNKDVFEEDFKRLMLAEAPKRFPAEVQRLMSGRI
jgi:hypothetical protein